MGVKNLVIHIERGTWAEIDQEYGAISNFYFAVGEKANIISN